MVRTHNLHRLELDKVTLKWVFHTCGIWNVLSHIYRPTKHSDAFLIKDCNPIKSMVTHSNIDTYNRGISKQCFLPKTYMCELTSLFMLINLGTLVVVSALLRIKQTLLTICSFLTVVKRSHAPSPHYCARFTVWHVSISCVQRLRSCLKLWRI